MFNKVFLGGYLSFILLLSTPADEARDCTRSLDVVFVLDSAFSEDNRHMGLIFARDVARRLHVSTYGTHVAQVHFGGNTSVVQGLNVTEFMVPGRSKSSRPGRNVADAIETTRRLVLNNMNGDRPEVPDVIVLITYGLADDINRAAAAAARAKADGIRILTVGITNTQMDQLREELREIATDPDDVENFILINSNYYGTVFSMLIKRLCGNRIEAENESLRLVHGTANTGRLETYINEEWVTVCSAGWTDLNTRIACKEMGYPDGQSMYTTNQTSYYRRIGFSNIHCTANHKSLLRCSHNPLFHVDSNCDHRRDVFLSCLCDDCNDYLPTDFVRLELDGTSMSGRLEVFSPGLGYRAVCSNGWTPSNTRVACRQLGFVDEAGVYQRKVSHPVSFMLFRVNCVGNESSLFDCEYTSMSSEGCSDPVYIRCECSTCSEVLLKSPQQKDAVTGTTVVFEWLLKHDISDYQLLFLSQKNPQTLIYVEAGKAVKENTRFKHHIQLINYANGTIGFILTNTTTADMGIYCLHAPKLLFDCKAILIVTDFAVVPDPVVHRHVHDRVVLSWDLTPLRKLRDIEHEILLTTPATGRLHLDYFYKHWLKSNPHRHGVPQHRDHLLPSIAIDNVTAQDAGSYVIEALLTSSVYPWVYYSWNFATDLVVVDNDTDFLSTRRITPTPIIDNITVRDTGYDATEAPLAATVLGILLGLSVFANFILIYVCLRCNNRSQPLLENNNRGNSFQEDNIEDPAPAQLQQNNEASF